MLCDAGGGTVVSGSRLTLKALLLTKMHRMFVVSAWSQKLLLRSRRLLNLPVGFSSHSPSTRLRDADLSLFQAASMELRRLIKPF